MAFKLVKTDRANLMTDTNTFTEDVEYWAKFKVTTATSASTPGTCVKKYPIYDASGTLLGYIPIYSSIT